MATITLRHPDGSIRIEECQNGTKKLTAKLNMGKQFLSKGSWETAYSLDLIRQILNVKGPAWVCDEIMRDEDPRYVQPNFEYGILSYLGGESFDDCRILDFGCGSGASTAILGRMFPSARVVGVDIVPDFVSIAKSRADFHGLSNLEFLVSQDGSSLPEGLGRFDYVVMSAVYEHLLPDERDSVLPMVWGSLNRSGVLFLFETPHRFFPIESHTTGLPLINYFPDKQALLFTRRFSKRIEPNASWESLLRRGIRGGTITGILGRLNNAPQKPVILEPSRLGMRDRIDIWYELSSSARLPSIKKAMKLSLKAFKLITGVTFVPSLTLALRKY